VSVDTRHYTYRVAWSPEDKEYVGTCLEFPSLSWLAKSTRSALVGIERVVRDVVADLEANGEPIPEPLANAGIQESSTSAFPVNCIGDTKPPNRESA
jgi:predicted RNase H-like HicB family nuclease